MDSRCSPVRVGTVRFGVIFGGAAGRGRALVRGRDATGVRTTRASGHRRREGRGPGGGAARGRRVHGLDRRRAPGSSGLDRPVFAHEPRETGDRVRAALGPDHRVSFRSRHRELGRGAVRGGRHRRRPAPAVRPGAWGRVLAAPVLGDAAAWRSGLRGGHRGPRLDHGDAAGAVRRAPRGARGATRPRRFRAPWPS